MDKDQGQFISVVRLKVESVNVVVFGRDDAGSRLKVYPRTDYISCVMEQVVTLDEVYLDTILGEFDVFYQLPKKKLNGGYSPIPDAQDRGVGSGSFQRSGSRPA